MLIIANSVVSLLLGRRILKLRDDIAPHVTRARRKSKAGMSRSTRMKAEGNEKFKAGRHEEAIPFYTKGIAGLTGAERGSALELALYNNRAACYQQISNHQAMVQARAPPER